jgi:uncharacterized membrane protein SpoIIM required for sporulation
VQDREKFVEARRPVWNELSSLLASGKPLSSLSGPKISRGAALYRAVCADLMQARQLGCGRDVISYLDLLTARAHNALYSSRSHAWRSAIDVLVSGFPRAFRANGRFMLMSAALFVIPLAVGWIGVIRSPSFASNVLPARLLEELSEAYAQGFSAGRAGDMNAEMTGFYVRNNVGIAFQCFATGILFALGSGFFLIFNGLAIGTVFGYVVHAGHGLNIATFVCGHSPFELTAIVIAGGAGIRMGTALVATRGRTRLGSLRSHAEDLVALVGGAAAMLVIAAMIEAFWSPSSLPREVKFVFAAVASMLVASFLAFGGRKSKPRVGEP